MTVRLDLAAHNLPAMLQSWWPDLNRTDSTNSGAVLPAQGSAFTTPGGESSADSIPGSLAQISSNPDGDKTWVTCCPCFASMLNPA